MNPSTDEYAARVREMDAAKLLTAYDDLWGEYNGCIRVDSSSCGRKDIAERGEVIRSEIMRRLNGATDDH